VTPPQDDGPIVETAPGDRALAARLELAEAEGYALPLQALSEDARRAHGLEVHRVGSAYAFVSRAHPDHAGLNRVVGLGVAEAADEAMLDAMSGLYRGVRSTVELAPAAQPEDLADRLASRGYRPVRPVAVYLNDLSAVPVPACDLRIAEVGPDLAEPFTAMTCAAYGYGEPFPSILRATFGLGGWRHWLAFDGDRPVSGGLLRIAGDTALSAWGATAPSHRGRGLHEALIATRFRAAREAGCRLVTGNSAVDGAGRASPALRNQFVVGSTVPYLRWLFVRGG
jgi:GNAT superfamily N-acetyltransferase